jgi:hypothetical protein
MRHHAREPLEQRDLTKPGVDAGRSLQALFSKTKNLTLKEMGRGFTNPSPALQIVNNTMFQLLTREPPRKTTIRDLKT